MSKLGPMPEAARRAFDRAYCAMLARRYPGTTWQPSSRDEIGANGPHPLAGDDLGGSLRTPQRTEPLGDWFPEPNASPDKNDRERGGDERS
jgi:hypothetical protein